MAKKNKKTAYVRCRGGSISCTYGCLGCGLCVDPKDIDAVTEAVRYLAEHPEEARRMGQSGRRWAEKKYNWAHEEAKLLALYRELVK